MALLQCNIFSKTLCFGTDINIIIPTPGGDDVLNNKDTSYLQEGVKFPVLYLLHGIHGDYSDWLRMTDIERYALKHKLVVVMPNGSNSFYQNMVYGSDYFTYMTQELPTFVQNMFPVSSRREDTYIAGVSMGGYGALKIALDNPEKYSASISLSGMLDIEGLYKDRKEAMAEVPIQWDFIFQDLDQISGSEADIFSLYEKKKKNGSVMPEIYVSCGTEDFLYESNKIAKNRLEKLKAKVTYHTSAGAHDWNYWNQAICQGLDWLFALREGK